MNKTWRFLVLLLITAVLFSFGENVAAQLSQLPESETIGELELVATFDGAMPTGVTVSQRGRIFVNFPRWGDDVPFTVGEVIGDRVVPYHLVSVQSVVVAIYI